MLEPIGVFGLELLGRLKFHLRAISAAIIQVMCYPSYDLLFVTPFQPDPSMMISLELPCTDCNLNGEVRLLSFVQFCAKKMFIFGI